MRQRCSSRKSTDFRDAEEEVALAFAVEDKSSLVLRHHHTMTALCGRTNAESHDGDGEAFAVARAQQDDA